MPNDKFDYADEFSNNIHNERGHETLKINDVISGRCQIRFEVKMSLQFQNEFQVISPKQPIKIGMISLKNFKSVKQRKYFE